ncbi:MAG: hypothetical protein ACFC03_00270 [Candidatus Malihini olakiniferum]
MSIYTSARFFRECGTGHTVNIKVTCNHNALLLYRHLREEARCIFETESKAI